MPFGPFGPLRQICLLCLCQSKSISEFRLLFLEKVIIPLNSDHKHLHHHHLVIGESPGYQGNFMDHTVMT